MRFMSFILCAIALAPFALRSSSACAQTSGQPTTQISREVEEVSLDIAAYEKNRPTLDLSPRDLRITDSGTPVRISSLRLVRRDSETKLLTLLIDRVDSVGRGNALKIASRILKSVPDSGFEISVLSIHGGLRLDQEFTSDRSLIQLAVKEATDDSPKALASAYARTNNLSHSANAGQDSTGTPVTAEQRLRAQALLTALEDARNITGEQHPSASVAALLGLVHGQSSLPGQKVIFFITQDPAAEGRDASTVAKIITSATAGGVEIFTFDANASNQVSREYLEAFSAVKTAMSLTNNSGVAHVIGREEGPQTTAPPGPPEVQAPGAPVMALGDVKTQGMTSFEKRRYNFLEIPEKHISSSACRVATYTGGACLRAGEDPGKTVRRAVEDISTYYEVSFVPATKEYDGKFHALDVKALRSGLKLRGRNGYFAVPPESYAGTQPFAARLLNVLAQPVLPNDVQFESRVLELGAAEKGTANLLLLQIPIDELETRDDANTNVYSAEVSVLAQVKDMSGHVVQSFVADIPQHGELDQKNQGRAEDLRFERPFFAEPGEYQMDVAVLDRNSGKAAAHRSTFRLADASRTPFLSDLSLVARMEPIPPEMAAGEPLLYGTSKIIPQLSGDLPQHHKQISVFSIIRLNARGIAQPQLALKLMRGDETLAQVPLPLPAGEEGGMRAHVANIDTSSLPAGTYRLIETLTQGQAAVEKSATFRILASDSAAAPDIHVAKTSSSDGTEAGPNVDTDAESAPPVSPLIRDVSPASVDHPSPEAVRAMVAAANKYVHRYSKSLPNFMCLEATRRSIDTSGHGQWKLKDTFTQLLGYDGKTETRKLLEMNGERIDGTNRRLNSSLPVSVGQFGGLLNLVFSPKAKTSFDWQGAAMLGSDLVQVMRYAVVPEHATITLRAGADAAVVGFHGLVYMDAATGGIRRITLDADNIPADFPYRSTEMVVEYGYVGIADHQYLLPTRASVSLREGSRKMQLNEITFRNYSRFGSETRILLPHQ